MHKAVRAGSGGTTKSGPRFWGYALESFENAANLMPTRTPPHICALEKATGKKQTASHLRPWACLAYVNDPRPGDKVSTGRGTALRALTMGYGL